MCNLICNFKYNKFRNMKKSIVLVAAIFFFGIFVVSAQTNENNGEKKSVISLDNKDVTSTPSFEPKANTKNKLSKETIAQEKAKKAQKKAEKAQKKAEKAQKKSERAQRKIEKEIKAKEKANKNYTNARSKYEKGLSRFEKLKNRGKLSPQDEVKWQKKLESMQNKIEKYQRKL